MRALVAQRHHGMSCAGVLFQVLNELPAVVVGIGSFVDDVGAADSALRRLFRCGGTTSNRRGRASAQCERVYVAIHEEDEWPWRTVDSWRRSI